MSDRPLRIAKIVVRRLAIPMRVRFEHAAAARDVADPIVVTLHGAAPFDQLVGVGETLAREYVTGESPDTVVADLLERFWALLGGFEATDFGAAVALADALPTRMDDRIVNAARSTVELAWLDLAGKAFRRRVADVGDQLRLPGFGQPGALPQVRYSGILIGRSARKLERLLRLQRCYGLRDYKLKVAIDGWEAQLAHVGRLLAKPIAAGRVTLRVDANGAWSFEQASAALPALESAGVCVLEQALSPEHDRQLAALDQQTSCALMADESLRTLEDAHRLLADGGTSVFNVRIAKNGGLIPALRIADMVLRAGGDVQLGCLVGETSVLTAAGLAFLECCPHVRFVEGAFGRILFAREIARPITFGLGGRLRPRTGPGLGVQIIPSQLDRFTTEERTRER